MYRGLIKRLIDIFIALIFLTLFSWVLLIIAYLVKRKLGSPILFKQDRPGKNGKIFKMYKFRSMTDTKDKDGNLLSDAERLPKFGKLLRATSLDELPELWNVLKGEMSLVGPRPLLVEYLERYNEFQKQRHEVRPGITGWAQINGRNAISWNEKFNLDVQYVHNYNFSLDIKILFLTVKKVFLKDGISAVGEATTEEFKGDKK
ncbi:sugar transferase [Cetobacterium sp.]|uniref:sugar transferase n=1 Tax=Cetobacterium sp. TaxID=2071632 RepID=UPI003F2E46BD